MSADWKLKLIALLHDPPDKAFGIIGHKERAKDLFAPLFGWEPGKEEWEHVESADRIAAAADRVSLPREFKVLDWLEKAALTHPLAGRLLQMGPIRADPDVMKRAITEALEELCADPSDDRKCCLRIWRSLMFKLPTKDPATGALWLLLPAETRQPDHSLWHHTSITAAIVTALPNPALLVFSIGPVQSFIATARRTQDLWMGSYILSYLTWQGIQVIASQFGPEALIYPSLRGQPLADLWLDKEGVWIERLPDEKELRMATFPNKFVALLPAGQAKQAAQDAECAIQTAWQRLADQVREQLASRAGIINDALWHALWQKQIQRMLEIYWCIYPWAGMNGHKPTGNADAVVQQYQSLCSPNDDWRFGKVYPVYLQRWWAVNVGTTYSLIYDLADRGFNARKGLRNFEPTEERGTKCTLCGQRQALRTESADAREFWSTLSAALRNEKRHEVKPNGAERLCAVCAVKRFVQREVFYSDLGLKGGFPSTSTVAAAAFCERLLKRLAEPNNDELWKAFQLFVRALQQARDREGKSIPTTRMDVPLLEKLAKQLLEPRQFAAKTFLDYDGDWLFEETYSGEKLNRNYALDFNEGTLAGLRAALEQLLTVMGDRPSRYFAALTMDGDFAGRWLSGTHPGLTTFGDVLHPGVQSDLAQRAEWSDVFNTQRVMTPAVHAAISEGLANFALKLVRWVVEERYPGRLVYAGGDDVLALLPMEYALQVARELRALFSGEAIIEPNDGLEVQFNNSSASGYMWFQGEPLLTIGPTATASIGIAIAHHLSPLDATLNAMREAEKAAKNLYGRNALCVYLLKRSGEQIRAGAKWFYPSDYPKESEPYDPNWRKQWGQDVSDTIALLGEVSQHLIKAMHDQPGLSMKFPYAVFDEARTLGGLRLPPQERMFAQEAELLRVLRRHKQGQWHPDGDEEEKMIESLANRLANLAQALHIHCPSEDSSPDEPQPGFVELAKWLLLLRFIVSGGGRE